MATWVPIIVAIVSAVGAICAALIAARSARRAKDFELQANRILELEKRLAESRAKIFEPMVEAVERLWDHMAAGKPLDADTLKTVALNDIISFTHWVQIYGSDESVRVALRFMQAVYNSPPPNVLVRLLAELIVATRRDLGYQTTEIGPLEVLGMRITDAYTNEEYRKDLSDPLEAVFARYGWTPPWSPNNPERRT